jgi:asparagine synthase (glutamine-hydrolysing)
MACSPWQYGIKKQRVLVVRRDRYGIKPLYYSMQNGVLLFASEIKAFYGILVLK